MPTLFHKAAVSVHKQIMNWRASTEARRLGRSNGPCRTLANALETYLRDSDEIDAVEIEGLRLRLEKSSALLTFDDLGSGMHRGLRETGSKGVTRHVRTVMKSSAPVHECQLLHSLVSTFQPEVGVELGTCLGISAAYQGLAMENSGTGMLYTIEGGEALASAAVDNLALLGSRRVEVINGSFADALPTLLAAVPSINYAFIDGHHDGDATVHYFDLIKPKLASGSVVVFDDLSWSPSMRKAWRTIANDESIACTADLFALGIGIVN